MLWRVPAARRAPALSAEARAFMLSAQRAHATTATAGKSACQARTKSMRGAKE